MKDITKKELQILEFMQEEVRKKGYPPTIREICAAVGIPSTSTVHKAVSNLEKHGYIRKDPSKRRAVEIFSQPAGKEPVRKSRKDSSAGRTPSDSMDGLGADVVNIPLVGRVAAGMPILAEENIEDTMPMPTRFVTGGGDNFMLTVKGDSMVEAGIFDGDYILVHGQKDASNGEIVVAMVEGDYEPEATVKTFYREKGHIRLQPENPSMSPIIAKDVQIIGIVKGVFRQL